MTTKYVNWGEARVKKNRSKVIIMVCIIGLALLLGACDSSNGEKIGESQNELENNNSTIDTDKSSVELTESIDSTENNSNTNKEDTSKSDNKVSNHTSDKEKEQEEDSSIEHKETNIKEKYVQKLNVTKKEADELEPTDSSTFAIKKVEDDRWMIWDDLLNEIYGVLKEQLPPEEMEQLREEQRNWLQYRDDTALEASYKYKGGTQEHVEYVAVLANLTEERCFELVRIYLN